MRNQFILIFIIFFNFLAISEAEESLNVLVEDSLIREDFMQPNPSISIIDATEIKKNKFSSLTDVLRTIPGVNVAQNGGLNQSTSVFIRGAESRHTLVLVDNIEINDPLNPSRAFDFSGLTTENIERIEIIRGAQSVRFGSDAIGGVINIITKEGTGKLSGLTHLEIGSYDTLTAGLSVFGAENNFHYSLGTAYIKSSGFSSADKNDGNTEADGFNRLSFASRLGWKFSNDTSLNFTLRTSILQSAIDSFGGPGGDDPNYNSDARQLQVGSLFKSRAMEEKLSYSLSYGLASTSRIDENEPDALRTDQSTDYFTGLNSKIESRNEYILSEKHLLQFGAQLRNEIGHSENTFNGVASDLPEKSADSKGVYIAHKYESEAYLSEIGLREDVRNQYAAITNYSLNAGYKVPTSETIIYFNYGTGFKTPSLFQLYSSYGNQNLNEEKSSSAELSIEKKWGPRLFLSAAYFINQYYDLIDFDAVNSKYFNVAKSSSRGIELQSKWQATDFTFFKTSLTYLNTKNEVTGEKLLRRPELNLNAEITYIYESLESSLEYLFVGNRKDMDPVSFQPTTMPEYDLVNLKWIYASTNQLSFNAKIFNLFNRKYQNVAGYGTAELSGSVGVSKSF